MANIDFNNTKFMNRNVCTLADTPLDVAKTETQS